MGKCCRDAEHTGKDVYVKAEPVNGFQEQYGPFFYEREIAAEGKIRKCIPYQKQAEEYHRDPEQGSQEIPNAVLQRQLACIVHSGWFALWMPPPKSLHKFPLLGIC